MFRELLTLIGLRNASDLRVSVRSDGDVEAVGMKEAWHLADGNGSRSAPDIVKLHPKRWTIEPGFRDSMDLRPGVGLSMLRPRVKLREHLVLVALLSQLD